MTTTFTCSIDDGHPSDRKLADILHKHDLNATFFIPIKNQEGYPVMSPAQMREIHSQFEVGSHTHDHCFLRPLNLPQARYQILEGKRELEDILGDRVQGFCYPGGSYRDEHIDLVKRSGFSYARTTTNLCFNAGKSKFEMPTTCQFYPHNKSVYVRNYIKRLNWTHRKTALNLVLKENNWLARMYALFDYADQHDSIFHLWLHSHNIDDLHLWNELDAFLGHVAARVQLVDRLDNRQLATRYYV